MKAKLLSLLVIVFGVLFSNSADASSAAHQLAGLALDDSIFYIAGSGSDKLSDDFEQTVLNDLANDPSVKTFVEQVKTAVFPQIDLDSDVMEKIEFVKGIAEQTRIFKDPVLAGVVIDKFDPRNEQIEGCLYVVSTGGQAKVEVIKDTIISSFEKHDMADDLEVETEKVQAVGKVIKFSEKDDDEDADDDEDDDEDVEPVMCLANIGDHVIFILTVDGQEDAYLQKLAANIKARSKPVMAFAGPEYDGDGIIAALNYKNYFNMIEQMMDASGDKEAQAVKGMFEKMNLKELGTLYYRIGFKGKQVVLDVFGDQLGSSVFADFSRPIDKKLIKVVPADSTGFSMFNYNFEKLFYMYRDMIAAVDENAIAEIEKGLNGFQEEIGVNLGDGLLHNITGEVLTSFNTNQTTGLMGGSVSCLMTVKDADLFGQTIDGLVGFAKEQLEGSPVSLNYNITEQDGKAFRSILVPQLAMFGLQPNIVTLDETHIIISTSAQSAAKTVELWNAEDLSMSILSDEKYKAAVAEAPAELYYLEYTDSEDFLKAMCTTMNTYWPMLTMVASQKDIVLPPMLPQVQTLFDDLPPSVSWSYPVGETGVMSHIETDGVAIAAIGSAYVGVVGAVVSPAMHKAQENAQKAVCLSNLKIIGTAIITYQLDNNKYPESLDDLEGYLKDGCPECPQHINGYVYRGGDLKDGCDSQMILAYCPDHMKGKQGFVITLFSDGHVETLWPDGFKDKIKADNELRTKAGLETKPAVGIDDAEGKAEPMSEF